ELISLIFTSIVFFSFFILFYWKYINFFILLSISTIIKFVVLWIDIFAREIIVLPHSGIDSENYFEAGKLLSENLSLFSGEIYGGIYSKILGILFYLFSPDRFMAQSLNIFLS